MFVQTRFIGLATIASLTLTSCQSMNNKERGAAIGAAVGGALGGVVGNNTGSGNTTRGVLIGAVIGGAAGAVIGHQMDQQKKEMDGTIKGATIERVGEGIQVTFDSGLLFDFDSDVLRPEARANLTELAKSLQKYPNSQILIVGHTDSQGADEYNLGLSERRANSAAWYLETQGVPRTRLATRGRGELEPVAANSTETGQQQNRRVEVAIFASEAYREQLKKSYQGS
jgi:outer membrane protein OmpA-like peptidoglycan-associated protein